MQHSELLDTYYSLYSIFDSMDILVDAIRELTPTNKTKSCILTNLECARVWNLDYELNTLYDLKMDVLRDFKLQCYLRQKKCGYQLTILDLMGSEWLN